MKFSDSGVCVLDDTACVSLETVGPTERRNAFLVYPALGGTDPDSITDGESAMCAPRGRTLLDLKPGIAAYPCALSSAPTPSTAPAPLGSAG
jgi:hypothetical protein